MTLSELIKALEAAEGSNRLLDVDCSVFIDRCKGNQSSRLPDEGSLSGAFYFEKGPYDEDGDPDRFGLAFAADFTSTKELRDLAISTLISQEGGQ